MTHSSSIRSRSLVFRLFVSSTFSDMKQEREVLQARVFPRLRDYCKARKATFQAVDLRWGISQEAGQDQQTMNICLRELKRCQEVTPRPNFLTLLGDRYGWRPLPPQIEADEFEELERNLTTDQTDGADEKERLGKWYRRDNNAVPAEYVLLPREGTFEDSRRWGQEERTLRAILLRAIEAAGWRKTDSRRDKYFQSATHQEIDAGALALTDPEDKVLACFREIANLPRASEACDFADWYEDGGPDEEARAHLRDVRATLEARLPEANRFAYRAEWTDAGLRADWDAFAAWVEANLRRIIDREIDETQAQAADPLEQENAEHDTFAKNRARHFIGRQELLGQIDSYLHNTEPRQSPFVVYGVSGSGKTTLMAEAWRRVSRGEWRRVSRGEWRMSSGEVMSRFVAATPGSSNLRSLLTELCEQLRWRFGPQSDEPIPDDIDKLVVHFRLLLGHVPEDRRLVLFLDALDQLDDQDNPHTLSWLPRELPGNVRIVVSVLDRPGEPAGRAVESARRVFPDLALHRIEPLSRDDAGPLLKSWLSDAGRALQPAQQEAVLRGFEQNGLPLWLKLVAEEAKSWHAWGPPAVLPATIPDLLDQFMSALEEPRRHGCELVSAALGYLAAARNGLADEELLDLVALDPDYWRHFTQTAIHDIPGQRLPPVMWARLHGDLAFALTQRYADAAVLNTFYHRQIAEAAQRRYLAPRSRDLHSRMGDYFHAQPHAHEGSPNLRKLSELIGQWVEAERWDDLIGTETVLGPLSDLLFIQAKCEAGLVHELVTDYGQALAALPESAEENERNRRRDEAMFAYNKALREYAVLRYEWLRAKERGASAPEPPYPPLPVAFHEGETIAIPEEASERAARLRYFANFVSGHIRLLSEWPTDVLPLAFNDTHDGPVFAVAERQVADSETPWLRRSPRPPTQPLRPQCLRTLEGHRHFVNSVSLSPDGRLAVSGSGRMFGTFGASGSRDTTLKIWDLESGVCLRTLEGHRDGVASVSLSPNGRLAVSGSEDHTLKVWDLESGACLRTLEGHSSTVKSASVCPDGRHALSGSSDGTLKVWDLESGTCLRTFQGHTDGVNSMSVSPDERRAVSGSSDGTLKVWDLKSGACLHTLQAHCGSVDSVSVSPDGRHAVSGHSDGTLKIWDLESGACLRTLQAHCGSVQSVSLSPDGRHAVSGSGSMVNSIDNTLKVWDLETGACLRTLEGHSRGVNSVILSPDGRRAVSASDDYTLRVWDLERGACPDVLEEHSDGITSVSLSPDGRRAVSASGDFVNSRDNVLKVWDPETGACLRTLEGHNDWIKSVNLSPDGRRAVSTGDNTLKIWDLESGACLHTLEGHSDEISSVSLSPDGRRAVSGSYDETLRVWDLENGACLRTLRGHSNWVNSVSVSLDGRRAVSGSSDDTLKVWDLESGACLRTLEAHSHVVWRVTLSPDGGRAVSGSHKGILRVWDLESGACLHTLEGHSDEITSVSLSPDGRRAVSASPDGTSRVWDLESGVCLLTAAVGKVSLSPDGRRAVSTRAHELMVWDLDSGQIIAVYAAGAYAWATAISSCGNRIVCGTSDGQMHFLTPVNFPPSGPAIVTALDPTRARCPYCAKDFAPATEVTTAIQEHSAIRNSQSEIAASAFEDPHLLAACPHCAKPLKFNPFFVEH